MLHRQYDNAQTVEDEAAILADFTQRSAKVYQQFPVWRDMVYAGHHRSTLDVFPCANSQGSLIFVHGGYWQQCNKADFAFIIPMLQQACFQCILLEYDLAPYSRIPKIVHQVGLALDYLQKQSWIEGRVVAVGHSAGAHLLANHLSHPLLSQSYLLSGIYDLAPIRNTHLNHALQLDDKTILRYSPLLQPLSSTIKCHILCGANELPELKHQSLLYFLYLQSLGDDIARATHHVLPGCNHYTILDHFFRYFSDISKM